MTIRNGREFLINPCPTNIPDEVLRAMRRLEIDIYDGSLLDVTASCLHNLKTVFRTEGRSYISIANGHGAWEAALGNVLSRGERVLVLVLKSGHFSLGWSEMPHAMGIDVEISPVRSAVDPAMLEARLRAAAAGRIKALLVAHVDTASGVVNDIPAIRRAIDAAGHGALLMVVAMASLGAMPFAMDAWGVDVALTGSQKGLMCPPGLAFIAANDKALAAHRPAGLRTPYWDLTARKGPEHHHKYCGAAPEHLLFALRRALNMLLAEELDAAAHRRALLAEAVRRAATVWAENGVIEFNILAPDQRADVVTTLRMRPPEPMNRLRQFRRDTCGATISGTIGSLAGKGFRIGHMGHVNAPMVLGTLGVIEAGLRAIGVPHGRGGMSAAIEWLGSETSG